MHCSFPTRNQLYGGTHIYRSWKKAAPQFPLRDEGCWALWASMQLEIPKLINDNHVRRDHGTCWQNTRASSAVYCSWVSLRVVVSLLPPLQTASWVANNVLACLSARSLLTHTYSSLQACLWSVHWCLWNSGILLAHHCVASGMNWTTKGKKRTCSGKTGHSSVVHKACHKSKCRTKLYQHFLL